MRKYFIPKPWFLMLLMVGCIWVFCAAAFAQSLIAGQDQALFGFKWGDILLGITTSVLTSVWSKVHWPNIVKQWSAFALAVIFTIGAAVYMKFVTPVSITPENFKATFDAIFSSVGVTYLILSKPLRSLQENVNPGNAPAPALPK